VTAISESHPRYPGYSYLLCISWVPKLVKVSMHRDERVTFGTREGFKNYDERFHASS